MDISESMKKVMKEKDYDTISFMNVINVYINFANKTLDILDTYNDEFSNTIQPLIQAHNSQAIYNGMRCLRYISICGIDNNCVDGYTVVGYVLVDDVERLQVISIPGEIFDHLSLREMENVSKKFILDKVKVFSYDQVNNTLIEFANKIQHSINELAKHVIKVTNIINQSYLLSDQFVIDKKAYYEDNKYKEKE